MAKKKKGKSEEDEAQDVYLAVRIRGAPGMRGKISDTLKMLGLHKINHATLVWGNKSYMGMLRKCKDYIAYGKVTEKTLVRLLRVRGRIEGNKPLTDEHVKHATEYKNIKELARALMEGEIQYKEKSLFKLKPIFRLHPPRKGFRGTIKRSFAEGGTLGKCPEDYMNNLIYRMM